MVLYLSFVVLVLIVSRDPWQASIVLKVALTRPVHSTLGVNLDTFIQRLLSPPGFILVHAPRNQFAARALRYEADSAYRSLSTFHLSKENLQRL